MDPTTPDPVSSVPTHPAPAEEAPPERPPAPPRFRLFGPEAIGAATFIGGPFAGGVTMFVNDLKMGKAGRGVAWLIGAIAMTAALMALGMRVDLGVGMTAVNVALALGARALATKVFDRELTALQNAEIPPRGPGAGVLVALPVLALLLALIFGTGMVGHEGDKHQFGTLGVYVRDGATVAEAEVVAEFFARETPGTVDLFIDREEAVFVVGMVMSEAWYEIENREQLAVRIANRISATILDGDAAVFGATDPNFEFVERFASDGRLGRALPWGDDDMVFGRVGVTDEQLEAAQAALDGSEWGAEDGVAVALHSDDAGNLRACALVLDENLETPGLGATVRAMVSGIPGLKGVDICNIDGDVVRVAQ